MSETKVGSKNPHPGTVNLGKFLKEKRIESGSSQAKVAEKLGYTSPQFVSNWERGLATPPISTLRKIAEIYHIPLDEMFNVVLEITIANAKADLIRKFNKKK